MEPSSDVKTEVTDCHLGHDFDRVHLTLLRHLLDVHDNLLFLKVNKSLDFSSHSSLALGPYSCRQLVNNSTRLLSIRFGLIVWWGPREDRYGWILFRTKVLLCICLMRTHSLVGGILFNGLMEKGPPIKGPHIFSKEGIRKCPQMGAPLGKQINPTTPFCSSQPHPTTVVGLVW
jgi:hypothetical protein